MGITTRRGTVLVLGAMLMGLGLAACSPGAAPSDSPSSPDSTAPAISSTPSETPTGTGTPDEAYCTTAQLAGRVGAGSGGAAGSTGITIVLSNTSDASCALQGWPGVSLVGGGNGTQIGAAAVQDRTNFPHDTVTIAPGGTASIPLQIAQAANYSDANCKPQKADGFRVYPPGETASLFVKDADVTGCANTTIVLLHVAAVQPAD